MNMENNSAVVKIQGDPAYHTMQMDDANIEINPAYVKLESNPTYNNYYYEHGEKFNCCKNGG